MSALGKIQQPMTAEDILKDAKETKAKFSKKHGGKSYRMTLDVPEELYERIREGCFRDRVSFSEVVREYFEQRYPVA